MGLNIIYNEDCLETMKAIDNDTIDLTVTSPPYDSLRIYNGYSFNFPQVAKSLYEVTKPVESDLLNENNIKGIEK